MCPHELAVDEHARIEIELLEHDPRPTAERRRLGTSNVRRYHHVHASTQRAARLFETNRWILDQPNPHQVQVDAPGTSASTNSVSSPSGSSGSAAISRRPSCQPNRHGPPRSIRLPVIAASRTRVSTDARVEHDFAARDAGEVGSRRGVERRVQLLVARGLDAVERCARLADGPSRQTPDHCGESSPVEVNRCRSSTATAIPSEASTAAATSESLTIRSTSTTSTVPPA